MDPDRLQDRIEKAGGQTLLNIGAGEKTLDDHINVDGRALPGDRMLVADVRRLPFEPETVDGITCVHLVEHFREHELRTVILPYWHALLRPGGRLTIVCPNLQACVDMLNDGRLTIDEFGLLVYGGQEYEGDDHFAGYTPRDARGGAARRRLRRRRGHHRGTTRRDLPGARSRRDPLTMRVCVIDTDLAAGDILRPPGSPPVEMHVISFGAGSNGSNRMATSSCTPSGPTQPT